MSEPKLGDYVFFKLSPSGIEGTCLLAEEGHGDKTGEPMFVGHQQTRKGEIRVVPLYRSDTLDVLKSGEAECWSCGHRWRAAWPEDTDLLECPKCKEMMGVGEAIT